MVDFRAKKAKKDVAAPEKKKVVGMEQLAGKGGTAQVVRASIPDDQKLLILPPSKFYADEQVRRKFDENEIKERAASMDANGQFQPIVVHPADAKGRHLIDKGECRWRAAQLIKGFKLKAIIDLEAPKRSRAKRIIGQISENDSRSNLANMEMAIAVGELSKEGLQQDEIAKELGWLAKESGKPNIMKVSRYLSILRLPEEGQALVEDEVVVDLMTLEYLRKIHEINPAKFSVLCALAIDDGLTRKRAEQEFKQCKANAAGEGGSQDAPLSTSKANSFEAGGEGEGSSQSSQAQLGAVVKKDESSTATKTAPAKKSASIAVHVSTDEHGEGILCFESAPEEGFAWIRLESGGREHVPADALKVVKVVC